MEEQMQRERVEATKTSEHQLQSIMSELCVLKEKHKKDTKARKADEKTLLENIKASIDPILKSDYKTSDHISVGAGLKHLQDEVTNYLPPTVNKKTWSCRHNQRHLRRSNSWWIQRCKTCAFR